MVFSGILLPRFGVQNNWNGVGGQQPTVRRKSIMQFLSLEFVIIATVFFFFFKKSLFFF